MDPLDVVLATGRERSVEPSIGVRPASRVKGESSAEFWVFLVDDDHDVLESLTRLLRTTGYRIKAYSSSETFLAEHDISVPGCVVLDMAMPVLNGLDVQRVLKRQDFERPVIFLTGHANIHSTVLAMRAGATKVRIKVDGTPWFKGAATCVLVGNVGTASGGLVVFPDAEPDDGAFGEAHLRPSHGPDQLTRPIGQPLAVTLTGGN